MPKLRLTDDQVSELIDTVNGAIYDLRNDMAGADPRDAGLVEQKHREGVLLEILEVLEDAV